MNILIFLFVLLVVSVVVKNGSESWRRALAPGNKIRAERKASKARAKRIDYEIDVLSGIDE